jgi:hypothetical protein
MTELRIAKQTVSRGRRLFDLLASTKQLAREYKDLTGRPLGVTGEIAEYEAARLLKLTLTPVRSAGFDAVRRADGQRLQIKGRCVPTGGKKSQRLGRIDPKKPFDSVLLVLLDEDFNAVEMHEADRQAVLRTLRMKGSKARNERGQLAVSKFKKIGRVIWPPKLVRASRLRGYA